VVEKNLDRSFFRFVTMHAFERQMDGRTDERTEFSSLDRVCIPCSEVKMRCIRDCCKYFFL